MRDETAESGSNAMIELVFNKLKETGVRPAKLKKIKCLLQKPEDKESCATARTFGVALSNQHLESDDTGSNIPRFLRRATDFLSDNLTSENIFRKNGLLRRQKELKKVLNEGGTFDGAPVDDVASLFKQWFRELPEPIIPFAYHDLFFTCHEICKEKNNQTAVLLACLLLPASHLNALKHTLKFLASVAFHSKVNRMDSWNLGVVMAPNFLPPEKDNIDKMEKASNKLVQIQTELVQMLIDHAQEVGTLPSCQTLFPSEDDSQDNVVDLALRRKKRKSMHEVVDCLRKRVGQTPLEDATRKPPTRSASKRKADNSPLPQPSPCKKRVIGQMSLPSPIPDTGSSTPLTPFSHQLNQINFCGTSVYSSPTPRKGFGLLRRRSRYRKSKCFASPYKRNAKKMYNNKQESQASRCTPDPFVMNAFNSVDQQDLIISNSNEPSTDRCTKGEKVIEESKISADGNESCSLKVNVGTQPTAEEKSLVGTEVSLNSTDSEINTPIQFMEVDGSARKMCLRRGRPNTLKMGLKSPFVPRSTSEPVYISKMGTANPERKMESKAEAFILDYSPQPQTTLPSEPAQKTLRRSLSESDSSLRRFLTENILNALSFSSEEFSLGSTNDGKTEEGAPLIEEQNKCEFAASLSWDILDDPVSISGWSAITTPGKDLSIGEQSLSNNWSHCNSDIQNPFSVNTFNSDVGTVPSMDSISHIETPGRDLESSIENIMESVIPNIVHTESGMKELAILASPPCSAEIDGKATAKKNSPVITCSTPVQSNKAWMNKEEFKALLDDVPSEAEGTKRESILKIRSLNAGRVRANIDHYDKITCRKDSPYPNPGDGVFGRNGLVTRSVRDRGAQKIDSQGFVVPKGIPASIKRCTRTVRSHSTGQDSPPIRRGSNIREARSAEKKLVSSKNELNAKPLKSKLCFSDEFKENKGAKIDRKFADS